MQRNNKGNGFAFVVAVGLLSILGAGSGLRADKASESYDSNRFDKIEVVGLTDDGRLGRFRADSPGKAREIGAVSGLSGNDTALVGIDFRVQDGKYGVGNGGGVYSIDPATARAQLVNALTIPLNGTHFGVDFNPAADRLRIISDTGQNLAHNVNAGGVTVANATLTYTAPPATPMPATGLTGAAYTNNDAAPEGAPTATTLFDVDTALDQVVIQSPPGNGILVATGKLGFDAGPSAGFDIYSHVVSGVTVANRVFAVLSIKGIFNFYGVDLTTGRARLIGDYEDSVFDIAIPLTQ